jgi:hypothetical protein
MKPFSKSGWREAIGQCAARHARPRSGARLVARFSVRFTACVSVCASLLLAGGIAHATSLDDALACNDDAHSYIQSLQDRHLIAGHAMHVEEDGLNVYWPTRGAGLTAYNLTVFAVLGYQQNDPMFAPGKGEPMDGGLYGVVVTAETATAASAVAAAGSPAEYKHAGPLLTAIYCRKH